MLATGVQRRGSLAFEYYFPWSGGKPGWISGMATATGMQAFGNLGKRDGDTRYTNAARSMIGVFKSPPPWGVTVQGQAGPSFLLYSQSPSVLVGNGIAQAVIALDNYRAATGDPEAAALVDAALAEAAPAAAAVRHRRLVAVRPQPDASRAPSPTSPTTSCSRASSDQLCTKFGEPFCARGRELRPLRERADRDHVGQRRRCSASASGSPRASSLSKRGSVRVTLERDGSAVRAWSGGMLRGGHTLIWTLPPKGDYDLVVKATSLNGIASEASSITTL